MNGRETSQVILSLANGLESSQNPMPRELQNEDALLRKIADSSRSSRSKTPWRSVSLGIGDDAALFQPKPGHQTILTCDWFLEGTHFLPDKHPPDSVGWKCLARAVSDVAAMGGTPRCFLLSLALPEANTGRWLGAFLAGLRRASRKFQCPLAGGDTTRRDEILINVTVVVGEAELGLQIVRRGKGAVEKNNPFTRKHLYPEPRLALGQWLVKKGLATAMMDLSDGLSSDLSRLCAASVVGALLEKTKIPQVQIPDAALKQGHDPLQIALHGGDDYELLFTVPPRNAKLLPKTFRGVGLTAMGRITRNRKLLVLDERGRAMQLHPRGWDPFRKKL